MKETKRRTLLKALSYRIMATVATITVAYLFTGSVDSALHIGVADFFVKTTLYYGNERVWSSVRWGLKPGKAQRKFRIHGLKRLK